MTSPARRTLAILIGSAIAVAVLSACQLQDTPADEASLEDVSETWRAEIDRLLSSENEGIDDVHREILTDYRITDAEYSELQGMLSSCLDGHGIEYTLLPDGGVDVAQLPGDEGNDMTDAFTWECLSATVNPIGALYFGMQEDPEGLTDGEAMRRCLDQGEVQEYTGLNAVELERMIRAVEIEPTTPEAMVCFLDPFGTEGLTLAEAEGILRAERVDLELGLDAGD